MQVLKELQGTGQTRQEKYAKSKSDSQFLSRDSFMTDKELKSGVT